MKRIIVLGFLILTSCNNRPVYITTPLLESTASVEPSILSKTYSSSDINNLNTTTLKDNIIDSKNKSKLIDSLIGSSNSLNQHNITISSSLSLTDDRFGNHEKAIKFDGIDSNILIYIPRPLSVSVSLWFKAEDSNNYFPTLFSYGEEFFHAHLLGANFYNEKRGGIGNYAAYDQVMKTRYLIEDKNNYFDNKWHHLYSSYDRQSNKMKLYIDHELKGERIIDRDITASDYIEFGHASSDYPHVSWYKGEMSDIKIYDGGLTNEEISALYNEGN